MNGPLGKARSNVQRDVTMQFQIGRPDLIRQCLAKRITQQHSGISKRVKTVHFAKTDLTDVVKDSIIREKNRTRKGVLLESYIFS